MHLTNALRRREQEVYENILQRHPQDSDALYFLAVSQESKEDASELLRQMLVYEPGYDAAARVLATNLLQSGDPGDIREAFERLRDA